MLTRESLHHGLNTNNTINQLYKILYVIIFCPTILYSMSFHWYKIRIEDFCSREIKCALIHLSWEAQELQIGKTCDIVVDSTYDESFRDACKNYVVGPGKY